MANDFVKVDCWFLGHLLLRNLSFSLANDLNNFHLLSDVLNRVMVTFINNQVNYLNCCSFWQPSWCTLPSCPRSPGSTWWASTSGGPSGEPLRTALSISSEAPWVWNDLNYLMGICYDALLTHLACARHRCLIKWKACTIHDPPLYLIVVVSCWRSRRRALCLRVAEKKKSTEDLATPRGARCQGVLDADARRRPACRHGRLIERLVSSLSSIVGKSHPQKRRKTQSPHFGHVAFPIHAC